MAKLVEEIKYDLSYLRSHTLQPKWFKITKVLILLGFLVGYSLLSGLARTVLFSVVFVALSLVVHLAYRVKTKRWTQSWLDFVVVEENGVTRTRRIGRYYYSAVVLNFILSLAISQASFR
jgi:hypothetical protein